MNKFDQIFFQKFLPEGVKIEAIVHKHMIIIIEKIIINYFFGVILPSFVYFISELVQSYVPFFVLEGFLLIMFIKVLYDVFNWYNDVWIITNHGVVELDWALFSHNTVSVKYESIEGIELIQNGILDTILQKGKLTLHKIGGDNFVIENASKPYNAVNKIESYSKSKKSKIKEEKQPLDSKESLDLIVKALSGVVEEYLDKKGLTEEKKEELEEYIEKVKEKKGTIDIR